MTVLASLLEPGIEGGASWRQLLVRLSSLYRLHDPTRELSIKHYRGVHYDAGTS